MAMRYFLRGALKGAGSPSASSAATSSNHSSARATASPGSLPKPSVGPSGVSAEASHFPPRLVTRKSTQKWLQYKRKCSTHAVSLDGDELKTGKNNGRDGDTTAGRHNRHPRACAREAEGAPYLDPFAG